MLATALVEEKIINYRTIVRLHLCSCQSQQSVDSKECHYQNSWIQKQSAWNANIPPDLCKKFIRGAGGVGGGRCDFCDKTHTTDELRVIQSI